MRWRSTIKRKSALIFKPISTKTRRKLTALGLKHREKKKKSHHYTTATSPKPKERPAPKKWAKAQSLKKSFRRTALQKPNSKHSGKTTTPKLPSLKPRPKRCRPISTKRCQTHSL